MVTTDPVDTDREFIISFYLCDDSISVFEHPQKNSGKNLGTTAVLQLCRDLRYINISL